MELVPAINLEQPFAVVQVREAETALFIDLFASLEAGILDLSDVPLFAVVLDLKCELGIAQRVSAAGAELNPSPQSELG